MKMQLREQACNHNTSQISRKKIKSKNRKSSENRRTNKTTNNNDPDDVANEDTMK